MSDITTRSQKFAPPAGSESETKNELDGSCTTAASSRQLHRRDNSMKVVCYARFSSENQRDASITDQIEICRRFAEKQGWKILRTYEDRAMSGASRFRPAYQELLGDLALRRFDVVIVEA